MAKAMRKVRVGSVVSTRMDKTAVVEMVWKRRHRIYRKPMRRVTRFYVHDPERQCRIGDTVRIQETRPISRTKHWRLLDIVARREVAEVRAIELEGDAVIEPVEPEPAPSDSAPSQSAPSQSAPSQSALSEPDPVELDDDEEDA